MATRKRIPLYFPLRAHSPWGNESNVFFNRPLMVACANPAYKNEDLYALLERLKSHPQPAKVFSVVNHRREVRTCLFTHPTNYNGRSTFLFTVGPVSCGK